jgi:hypothetical protein
MPPAAPANPLKIDPPAAALVLPCATPPALPDGATAQDLGAWALAWIDAARCEASKRAALVASWPK